MLAIVNSLGSMVNKVGFWGKQHAPEIMIIGGVVGGTVATGLACYATYKASEDIGEAQAEIEAIEDTLKNVEDYTEESAKKDRRRVHLNLAGRLALRYAPAVGVGVASAASILGGANILNKRNASLAITASSLAAGIKDIRDGLIKEYGEEEGKKLYNKFRYGLTEEEVKEQIVDENGKKKTVKKKVMLVDPESKVRDVSYVRRFDWHNPYYLEDDPSYNIFYVRSQQNYANDKLRADHRLFMNAVDKALGFPETKAGQVAGWRYDPTDPRIDNFVDFNIEEVWEHDEYGTMRPVIYIEYNVDGSILNKVNWEE